jgi:hypothetical protein
MLVSNRAEFLLGIGESAIRFIDEATGDTVDPASVLEIASHGKVHIERKSSVRQITTERKAFGATREGLLTVVGYRSKPNIEKESE